MDILARVKQIANRRAVTAIPRPPGPRSLETLVAFTGYLQDPVRFVEKLTSNYGGISYFKVTRSSYFVSDPELIEDVLVRKSGYFIKDIMVNRLSDLLGSGLLISEGSLWKRQRRLAAPPLQRKHIAKYADTMVDYTERAVDGWESGDTLDFHAEMMELTLKIVVKTLFNVEFEEKIAEIGAAIDVAMDNFHQQVHTAWGFVPKSVPTPGARRYREAREHLDDVIFDLIEKRRELGEGDDLLYRLMLARDEDGNAMNLDQLRDETITMFLAGHETTALTVSYAWFLLTRYPETAMRLYDEVEAVLGDRRATMEDVEHLVYTRAVVQETLRLYPPAWIVGREAASDVVLGGWLIPKGAQVYISQWAVQRDPEWFSEPDTFLPERWLDGLEKRLPRFAYFPFGGGPRVCIGNHFAMMEAILLVATIARRTRLTPTPETLNRFLKLSPAVTLRPTTPIELRVTRRR